MHPRIEADLTAVAADTEILLQTKMCEISLLFLPTTGRLFMWKPRVGRKRKRTNKSPGLEETVPQPAANFDAQLQALERLVEELDRGSASLNQRATTAATISVAAIGALGVFGTQLPGLEAASCVRVASGIFVGIAAVAMVFAAVGAMSGAAPKRKGWGPIFIKRAAQILDGSAPDIEWLRSYKEALVHQYARNAGKAMRMRWVYRITTVAAGCSSVAVLIALVGAALH